MNDSELHAARNPLSRIHGDGGHYTEDYGLEKSIQDAEVKVVEMLSEISRLEALKTRTRAIREALDKSDSND